MRLRPPSLWKTHLVLFVLTALTWSSLARAQHEPAHDAGADAGAAVAAPAPPPAEPPANEKSPEGSPEAKESAKKAFESGLAHFDRSEWSAALADFLRSRELFPTRSATKNAAVCFRKEGRFDEALEMFETLLREFPDLNPVDRRFAEKEIAELRSSVGSIDIAAAEPGASIVVDGRARGSYPTEGPLRVSAGSHVLRVYKEGFQPFERKVDVAGRQLVTVEAKLQALTQAGRLSVTESKGLSLDVVVDNVVVGKSPWAGAQPVGEHTVLLRGEGDMGTQPATAVVRLGNVTALSLSAVPLTSGLRVTPVPAGATVSIDGVVVGQGVWEGKLRAGAHRLEVAAEGFLPARATPVLAEGKRRALTISLERDPSSELWKKKHPARVYAELQAGPVIGLTYGGDVRDACTGGCNAAVPFGGSGIVHGGYELSSGLTLGVDAGYMLVSAGVENRPAAVVPRGLAPNLGTVSDDLALRGFRFGPSAGLRLGEDVPVTIRLGAGAFVGSAVDVRNGTFQTSTAQPYGVDVSESPAVSYLYLAPEARISKRFPSRLEVGIGVSVLAMVALDTPSWSDAQPVLAAPAGQQGDGIGTFGRKSLAGSFLLAIVPTANVRYAF